MIQRTLLRPFQKFIQIEALSGILLLFSAVLALVFANSSLQELYSSIWRVPLGGLSIHEWVNDGLMTVFFLVVGLEIKREFLRGELSTPEKRVLPVAGALGGMLVPALIFSSFNGSKEGASGWGIPMATDIAFAIGVLSLVGKRVPHALKVFLTALAIVDDLGAVGVISFFYTQSISGVALSIGFFILAILYLLNRLKVRNALLYLALGVGLWMAFLQSGVHATVAGVLLAWVIPSSVGIRLEQVLHPWVSYGIMPIFAFANTGVSFSAGSIFHPIGYGIVAGLVLGKQIGITLFSGLSVCIGLAKLPDGVRFFQLYAIAWLGGIGFTMSLFMADLAWVEGPWIAIAKKAIFLGSLISGGIGAALVFAWGKQGISSGLGRAKGT